MNNSCCYVYLQISVKFHVSLSQSVERQVVDILYAPSKQESPQDGYMAVYVREFECMFWCMCVCVCVCVCE